MLKAIMIDDEIWARNIIRNFGQWAKLGIELVGEGEDGEQGLKLIEQLAPDIIITDMEMANMDGVDFLRNVERMSKDYKIIVISGHDDFGYMKQAIHSRAVEYILKPVDPEELNRALERCVKDLAMERQAESLEVHTLMDESVLGAMMEEVNQLRNELKGVDYNRTVRILEHIQAYVVKVEQDQEVQSKIIHDLLVHAFRDALMDVFQKESNVHDLYENINTQVTGGLSCKSYIVQANLMIKAAMDYRKKQMIDDEKPAAELAKEYIDSSFRQEISLSQVAEHVYVSKEYLSGAFKKRYGLTLNNYILKLKMTEAVKLLGEGVAHKNIASSLGYKDVSYFYKVFRKYYGCTPGDYENDGTVQ